MLRAGKTQPISGFSIAKDNGISMIIPFVRMRMIKHKKRLQEPALDNVANQRTVQIEHSAYTRVVLGDLNDLHSSKPVKTILGRGKKGLVDTRPAERNGDTPPYSDRRLAARNVCWTHYYATDDTYSRIDYILLSHGMAREWDATDTYILALPNWGLGSDHRPLVAAFSAEDK